MHVRANVKQGNHTLLDAYACGRSADQSVIVWDPSQSCCSGVMTTFPDASMFRLMTYQMSCWGLPTASATPYSAIWPVSWLTSRPAYGTGGELGRYDEVLAHLKTAELNRRALRLPATVALALLNIGVLCGRRGEYVAALQALTEGRRLDESRPLDVAYRPRLAAGRALRCEDRAW
jgi:hypothetical protein